MASLHQLVIGRFPEGVSFSSRLAQGCSLGSLKVLDSTRDQATRGKSSPVFTYGTSTNVPLTKISPTANAESMDGEIDSTFCS